MAKLNFSLTQLEYVLAVHKLGHFAKAAEHCFVTQPTLSMQIQKLEDSLGTTIFDRSKKPILLTEQGQKLVQQMRSIVQEANKLEAINEAGKSDILAGHLSVGVIPTIAPYLMPRVLPVLQKMYPELHLSIHEIQTHKIIEGLNEDTIDVGLLATPLGAPQIHERHLFWEPFSLLCRTDHALSKLKAICYSSLNSDDIWLLEEGHCLRNQVLDICSHMKRKNSKHLYQFESGSLETLKRIIDSIGGYTLIPDLAKDYLGAHVKVIPFERPIPARQIGLVSRRNQYKANLLKALETALLKCIPEALRLTKKKDLDVIPIS